jgi:hypothetical protein
LFLGDRQRTTQRAIRRIGDEGGTAANLQGGFAVKGKKVLIVLVLVLLVVVSCAPGPNTLAKSPDEEGKVAGFWWGLWHGFIAPITFIISLFNHHVQIYEVHNSGGWYNFGYLLGLSVILGGSGRGSRWRRRR